MSSASNKMSPDSSGEEIKDETLIDLEKIEMIGGYDAYEKINTERRSSLRRSSLRRSLKNSSLRMSGVFGNSVKFDISEDNANNISFASRNNSRSAKRQFGASSMTIGSSSRNLMSSRNLLDAMDASESDIVTPTQTRTYDNGLFKSKYKLEEQLGEGAFSTVLSGRAADGTKVAVKVIDKVSLSPESRIMMVREIEILRKIMHENILNLLGAYNEPNEYFIVTDLMKGGDLLSHVENLDSLKETSARSICQTLLSAVYYLHSRPIPIAHRDIKLENILLSSPTKNFAPESLRLADFGFAKEEVLPNSFITMCGTPAYVAPEILLQQKYGRKVDIWSVGVVAYSLLGGYQPFHAEDEKDVEQLIVKGAFDFDNDFWNIISEEAKEFISSLLVTDPEKRASTKEALKHPWFSKDIKDDDKDSADSSKLQVFFMIGSQRSGSNWLRTMLDQREDLVGPHPPHVMRDFMPLIGKFGDLTDDYSFRILVDHVCTFVEQNQVPWEDKHGQRIEFYRRTIYEQAKESVDRLLSNRASNSEDGSNSLEKELYLLSIFDAIMDFFAHANSKTTWMCKSMGMSQYHEYLLEFYGPKRLRYIYLVRDPRDVAMSFMKTPVGDCHYYAIIKKWVKLQSHALKILSDTPKLVCKVHYEELLEDKEAVVGRVYNFIGERRFGGIKRQASVLFMAPRDDLIASAKTGREAMNAHKLSYQFKNLIRGKSFAKHQNQKWRHPTTGLDDDALEIIESVAFDTMAYFNYETKLVGKIMAPTHFSEDQIANYTAVNEVAVKNMMETLKEENNEDYNRRVRQAEVLQMEPVWQSEQSAHWDESTPYTISQSLPESILSSLRDGIELEFEERGDLIGFGQIVTGVASQKGYYPDDLEKINQDSFDVCLDLGEQFGLNYLAVYDGHGPQGHYCSQLAKSLIPDLFAQFRSSGMSTQRSLTKVMLDVHQVMTTSPRISAELSGTTSISAVIEKNRITVCNVGDSSAIVGTRGDSSGAGTARFLCSPHDLNRIDDAIKIDKVGGLIMSSDEYTEYKESGKVDVDMESSASHRIWSSGAHDKLPGCAFTRSLGDSIAHSLGVSAKPEFQQMQLKPGQIIILASDGVTEFLSAEQCIDIVRKHVNPTEAAKSLVEAALQEWSKLNSYVDDITALVVFVNGR